MRQAKRWEALSQRYRRWQPPANRRSLDPVQLFGLVHGGTSPTKRAHQRPRKPLINLVIVGDDM